MKNRENEKIVSALNDLWPSKYDKVKGLIYLAGFEEGRKYERKSRGKKRK
jgi:hypothetical protein